MFERLRSRWLGSLSFGLLFLYALLGLTPYATGSFIAAGALGTVVSGLIALASLLGISSIVNGSLATETLVLRALGWLFATIGAGSVLFLLPTEFTQWQGVSLYFVASVCLFSRAGTYAAILKDQTP